ncbi:MAG: elongation factor G [Lachnospiraceae bacterium]|nr:elongation factor G [Lachnospiraceae bacterium]
MKIYTTDNIRNVVLLGHGGCGKTSLAEAMAYTTGVITRMGNVPDGSTISDYRREEQKRQFSIGLSVIPIEFQNTKINIIDTPGYQDFVGEVEAAAAAADAAIICVSGRDGVQSGTKKAWEFCEKYKLPRIFYVTEMDIDNASFRQVVEDLQALYGKHIAPLHLPIRQNGEFVGYVNVISQTGNKWKPDHTVEKVPVPDYSVDHMNQYRDALVEAVAETSEEFMERFFEGDEFSEDEIRATLKQNVAEGTVIPITMGSAVLARGIYTILDDIVKYLPSPLKRKCVGINYRTNELFEANYDFKKAKSAYIFKTIVDPFIGKYSLVKVCSGVLKAGDIIYNVAKDQDEKLAKIYIMRGSRTEEVSELHAGDIGALGALGSAKTGDTLATKTMPVTYTKTKFSTPYTYMKYEAVTKGEEDKVAQSLGKLCDEDPTMRFENDSANRQLLLYGMGDMHLEVIVSRLLSEYRVGIRLDRPRIAYKETIIGSSDVEAKHKKQSGGHGQYGHVKMRFSPSGNLDEPYTFSQEVVGGTVPKGYYPAVEKGIDDCVKKGPLAGYPVVGVNAVLYDGSYHPVDSSEMAFKTASIMAFKDGFMKATPVLLEPVMTLTVEAPDAYTGDILGDLNRHRGRVLGMKPIAGGKQEITAEITAEELYGYCTRLRSITGGEGDYKYEFVRYEQCPHEIQEREHAAYVDRD